MPEQTQSLLTTNDLNWLNKVCEAYNRENTDSDSLAARIDSGRALFYKRKALKTVCTCSLIQGKLVKEVPERKGLEKFKVNKLVSLDKLMSKVPGVGDHLGRVINKQNRRFDRIAELIDIHRPKHFDNPDNSEAGNVCLQPKAPLKDEYAQSNPNNRHTKTDENSASELPPTKKKKRIRKHNQKTVVQPSLEYSGNFREYQAYLERLLSEETLQGDDALNDQALPIERANEKDEPGIHDGKLRGAKQRQINRKRIPPPKRTHFPDELSPDAKRLDYPLLVPEKCPYKRYHSPKLRFKAYKKLLLNLDDATLTKFIERCPADSEAYFHACQRNDVHISDLPEIIRQLLEVTDQPPRKTPRLKLTGDPMIDAFRKSYHSGSLHEECKYVSITHKDTRLPAQLLGVSGEGVMAKVCNIDGSFAIRFIKGSALKHIRVSPGARSLLAPLNKYSFHSHKLNNYQARSGDLVTIDYGSPTLQKWMASATHLIHQRTGIRPGQNPTLSLQAREAIIQCWLTDIVPLVEDKSLPDGLSTYKYGEQRDRMIHDRHGCADIGILIDSQTAICRELSIFLSILLAEYGIASSVVTGNLKNRAHVWVQLYDQHGNVSGILDSNNVRRLYVPPENYPGSTLYITDLVKPSL